MRAWLATFGITAQMAFRNLFASRLKTIIVGGIIFFGGLLVVAGNSLLDSLVASISRSVIGSVAGHIQVYNAKSKDPPKNEAPKTAAEQYEALTKQFSDERAEVIKAVRAARPEDQQKVYGEKYPKVLDKYAEKFLELANRGRLDDVESSEKYKTREKSFPRERNGNQLGVTRLEQFDGGLLEGPGAAERSPLFEVDLVQPVGIQLGDSPFGGVFEGGRAG